MIQHQAACPHDYTEVYYGWMCKHCGLFFPFGAAPWDDPVESRFIDEEKDFDD